MTQGKEHLQKKLFSKSVYCFFFFFFLFFFGKRAASIVRVLFDFFWWERLQGQTADMVRQGHGWDWDA
jgi:hypothetical protein